MVLPTVRMPNQHLTTTTSVTTAPCECLVVDYFIVVEPECRERILQTYNFVLQACQHYRLIQNCSLDMFEISLKS